ncbi:MAG: dipeptide epimerase [Armatimonadetes bacterium]|nr:dipeptide epimerase [Armatimonadota bacterium]
MQLTYRRLTLTYRHAFGISRGSATQATNVLVELRDGDLVGRGEAVPFSFLGWPDEVVESTLAAMAPRLAPLSEVAPDALAMDLLDEFGAVRPAVNAVVSALWDLHGQRLGQPLWRLLGLDAARAGTSCMTIGLADREVMLAKAAEVVDMPILKVKCGGPDDLANVRALAEATGKPMWVDANCGWQPEQAAELAGALAELGVVMIEQPVPSGDGDLERLAAVKAVSPVPIVADESCAQMSDVARLWGAVDGVNIKLDKVGGISAGLRAVHAARAAGLGVMIGCFGSSSISVTATALLAPLADWRDLDGALLVADDPFAGVTLPRGRVVLPDGAGLGIVPTRAAT